MKDIFTVECRRALSNMLESNKQDSEDSTKVEIPAFLVHYIATWIIKYMDRKLADVT